MVRKQDPIEGTRKAESSQECGTRPTSLANDQAKATPKNKKKRKNKERGIRSSIFQPSIHVRLWWQMLSSGAMLCRRVAHATSCSMNSDVNETSFFTSQTRSMAVETSMSSVAINWSANVQHLAYKEVDRNGSRMRPRLWHLETSPTHHYNTPKLCVRS